MNFSITDTISPSGDHTQSRTITRDLKPNGSDITVNNVNKLEYIFYVARHRLQNQPQRQTSAFLHGLGEIIQPSWLSMFNQSEMQTLVGGDSTKIDIADLRNNTQYGGVYVIGDDHEEHPSVRMFWEVMNDSKILKEKLLYAVNSGAGFDLS